MCTQPLCDQICNLNGPQPPHLLLCRVVIALQEVIDRQTDGIVAETKSTYFIETIQGRTSVAACSHQGLTTEGPFTRHLLTDQLVQWLLNIRRWRTEDDYCDSNERNIN